MKKEYVKPEIDWVTILSQEDVTSGMEGGVMSGSTGLESSDGVIWDED